MMTLYPQNDSNKLPSIQNKRTILRTGFFINSLLIIISLFMNPCFSQASESEFQLMQNPSQAIVEKIGEENHLLVYVDPWLVMMIGKKGNAVQICQPAKKLAHEDGTLTQNGYELFSNKKFKKTIDNKPDAAHLHSVYLVPILDKIYQDKHGNEIETNYDHKHKALIFHTPLTKKLNDMFEKKGFALHAPAYENGFSLSQRHIIDAYQIRDIPRGR